MGKSKLFIWNDKHDPQFYTIAEGWRSNGGSMIYNTLMHIFCDGLASLKGFNLDDYSRIDTDPVEITLSIEIKDQF